MLWIAVLALIILAVAGGLALTKLLWFVLIVALIVAILAAVSGRRSA